MDILLAALLWMLGNVTGNHPDITVERLAQAANELKAIQQQADASADQGGSAASEAGNGITLVNKQDPQKDAPKIKGIYSTAYSAGGERLSSLLKLVDETDLNSLVIDIKDDNGYITYSTGNEELEAYGTSKKFIPDISKLMSTLKEHDIYPIARVVVFKDSVMAQKKPEWSYINPDGSLWANDKKDNFVNPYLQEVWDYNIKVAKEAARQGFKEIQFDYVRFPEGFEKKADSLKFYKDKRSRVDVVADFVKYAKQQLEPLGVRVSVDIFGYAASVPAAEGIGQDFVKISQYVDVISPMIYPSHYGTGWFKSKYPDTEPYKTIDGAMKDTHKKLDPIGTLKPVIRPWIQDFTASWLKVGYIKYGKKEVEAQIKALKDNGVDEYLLWNSTNRYSEGVEYK